MRRSSVLVLVVVATLGLVAWDGSAQATAPGRNGRIAFVRYFNDAHSRGAIFTIRPDGSGLIQVTHRGNDLLDSEPDWSPDGRWIMYYRQAPGEPQRLFKVRPNGTDVTRLTRGPCVPGNCPSSLDGVWSPDGKRIAFLRFDDPNGPDGIYMMRADGSNVHLVAEGGSSAGWSPNGKRLVFERDISEVRRAIFVVRLDGTHERRLTPWILHAGDHPDWSPDGLWIVFRSHVDQDRQGNVYLVHPDGTQLHRITHTFDGGATGYLSSSFSPNGRKITVAYSGVGERGEPDVWVMNLDGSGFQNVTRSEIWDSRPDWGPLRS